MNLTEAQDVVKKFNVDRDWLKNSDDVKDLLLNMCEESSEAWNLIKWVDLKKQKELINKQHDEWEDFVGDQLFLIFKIASIAGVDSEKAIKRTIKEYEERFPVDKIKGKHSNLNASGIDLKYTKGN